MDLNLNATDADGDILTFAAHSDTTAIVVSVLDSILTITPQENWSGLAQITVVVSDGRLAVSNTFDVTIVPVNDNPSNFSLIFPLGDTLNTLLPSFTWNPAIDPDFGDLTSYIIRISASETLILPIYTDTLFDTSYTLAVPLEDDSLYYWSITAFDTSGGFTFSDTLSFLLDKQESPEGFSLISPPHGGGIDSLRPVFNWESSIDPDPRDDVKYTLIIISESDTVYMSTGIEDTTHQVREDIEIGSYNWHVIAEDTDDDSLDTPSSEVFRLSVIIGIDDEFAGVPKEYDLYQNYPNPFNPSTIIKYALPKSSNISLVIYNLMGQQIMRWDENNVRPGYYTITWNSTTQAGIPVSSGIYLYRLQAGGFVQLRKMLLLK